MSKGASCLHETHFCEKTHGDDSRRDIINKDVLCIICSKTRSGDIRMINIEISDDFDLKKIAESGQCFRWQPIENDGYRIIHGGSCLCIWKNESVEKSVKSIKQFDENDNRKSSKAGIDGRNIYMLDCTEEDYNSIWSIYLDMDENYQSIRGKIDKENDPFLYEAAKAERGIRILKQDPWEALVSFIISQNRNIPAIKASIEKLAERAGEKKIDSRGEVFYTFPTPENIVAMSDEALAECKLGYRDQYVRRAAQAVACGELDFKEIDNGTDDEVLSNLMGLYGVGKKVASCMLLFGFHHLNAFPIDVWIKRVLETEYNNDYPFDNYSPYNGVYQQYMFAYYRNR